MNKKVSAVFAILAMSVMIFTGSASGQGNDVLKPGPYTAKVKAIVCGGCGPLIQKTLAEFKELESVSVDQKTSMLNFTVKKDFTVKMADLQKALDGAANRMKMGADYTLSDVKPK